MKILRLTSIALIAFAGSALASDLPSRKAAPAFVPPVPVFTWTGFYAGAQIGGGWGQSSDYSFVPMDKPRATGTGVVGGVHAGYNWQVNSLVLGLEGDVEGTGISKTFDPHQQFPHYNVGDQFNAKVPWQGSLRARAGVAIDRALIYATGGLAVANIKSYYTYLGGIGFAGGGDYFSATRTGWTMGAGLEYAFADNISARVEYRYSDFGSKTNHTVNWYSTERNSYTEQAVRIGLTYHFGAPAAAIVANR